jgi:hypothetical protein
MSFLTRTEGAHAPSAAAGRRPRTGLSTAAAVTFMIAVACYMLLPVYWLLVSSTKSQSDLVLALRPAGRRLRPLAGQQPAVRGSGRRRRHPAGRGGRVRARQVRLPRP